MLLVDVGSSHPPSSKCLLWFTGYPDHVQECLNEQTAVSVLLWRRFYPQLWDSLGSVLCDNKYKIGLLFDIIQSYLSL